MSKGICIGGPEQGRTVSMEGDLYKAMWPIDGPVDLAATPNIDEDLYKAMWPIDGPVDLAATPNIDEDPQVFVYRFHVMAVADNSTYTRSARHSFWVPKDEAEPNKLILEYLLDCQARVTGMKALAARAYKVIDWLMPGLKHISIPDYAEFNETLIGLRKIKDDNLYP